MRRYYDTVRSHFERVPTYVVRYEDLVLDPAATLQGLFCFLLDLPDLKGTNCEVRLNHVLAQGMEATQTYKLKDTTRKLNSHFSSYSPELLDLVKSELASHLYFFGYANLENTATSFFNFATHD